jgi:hypothetical protein
MVGTGGDLGIGAGVGVGAVDGVGVGVGAGIGVTLAQPANDSITNNPNVASVLISLDIAIAIPSSLFPLRFLALKNQY